jgi:hypothetical protein
VSDSKGERKLTIFVEEDLHRAVRVKGAPLGLPFQQLVVIALRDWVKEPESSGSPLMDQLLQQPTDADEELIRRLLVFWRNPKGAVEPHIRDLVAKAIGVDPPK